MRGDLHASVKALQGYCALHRLLLHCCDAWPETQDAIEQALSRFIERPAERHKSATPDLGVLLCLLTASRRRGWPDLRHSWY
eukprot:gene1073-16996_t